MAPWVEKAILIICSVLASSGLWAFIQSRLDRKDAKSRMILGLGHDRLMFLCSRYIERGWISNDEYEDLTKYLYKPYQDMGGNGTVERLMNEIRNLPIRNMNYQPKKGLFWRRRQRVTRRERVITHASK